MKAGILIIIVGLIKYIGAGERCQEIDGNTISKTGDQNGCPIPDGPSINGHPVPLVEPLVITQSTNLTIIGGPFTVNYVAIGGGGFGGSAGGGSGFLKVGEYKIKNKPLAVTIGAGGKSVDWGGRDGDPTMIGKKVVVKGGMRGGSDGQGVRGGDGWNGGGGYACCFDVTFVGGSGGYNGGDGGDGRGDRRQGDGGRGDDQRLPRLNILSPGRGGKNERFYGGGGGGIIVEGHKPLGEAPEWMGIRGEGFGAGGGGGGPEEEWRGLPGLVILY